MLSDHRTPKPREHSTPRRAWLVGLSALALLAAGRVIQLAGAPAVESKQPTAASAASTHAIRADGSVAHQQPVSPDAELNAELAQLYAMCPESAVVGWDAVVASPEQAAAQLPPVRETAAREPQSAPWPGRSQPTVKYPLPVRIATRPLPNYRVAAAGEWLVDPGEWFTEDERGQQTAEPVTPPPDEPPAAIETPASAPPAEPEVQQPMEAPLEPPIDEVESPADERIDFDAMEQTPVVDPATDSPQFDLPAVVVDEPEPLEPLPTESTPTEFDASPTVETSAPWPAEPAADASEPELPPEDLWLVDPPTGDPPSGGVTEPQSEELPPVPPAPLFPTPPPPPQYGTTTPAATEPLVTPAPIQQPGLPQAPAAKPGEPQGPVDPHLELFAKNCYPSARDCAKCHEEIYEQWSVSAHAYANVSPMFHKFEQKLNDLSQGTVGYFCMRCHAPVATSMYVSRDEPLWNLPEVAREGVTCIACHRVQYMYGKSNGERRIETGPIFAPVFGGIGGDGVADAVHRKQHFKVKTSPDEKGPGQDMHVEGIYFEQLTRSEFCAPCHQVAVHPGIKLEVVWEQYRASPACKKGIQCQDCHMGRVPGMPLGYDCGPVAKIADKTVNDNRRKSNHIFHGPNYPIAHPGVFPFHLKGERWNMQEWLLFDWRAGWGTDDFEDALADGKIAAQFPPVWAEADDRYDAREIIEDNFKKLHHKREIRVEVMENGSHVDGPIFDRPPCRGEDLKFHYVIANTNEGHNLLTASLGAQPQLWANVALIGPNGHRLWETGYTDSYGDLANIHSEDVRHKRLPFDWQLMNLQSMFLITGVKGTDREFFLPVNLDFDQLPFIRPGAQPISVINHPPFIRMESQSLAPLGSRRVPYKIPGELLRQPGRYRLSFRMRSRAEPPYFMRFCEATPDMLRSMNEWMVDVHPMTVEFYVR